ncbi:MAG: hypothetical protein ACRBB0_14570 [Pelagimonas sp.]|uniref:hypothetical protein n=1 Tax=Pelagimonas sp. TaxID=2073170 RepID=UPI003D6BB789
MTTAETRKSSAVEQVNTANIDKLHSKFGQLGVECFLSPQEHASWSVYQQRLDRRADERKDQNKHERKRRVARHPPD